MADPIDMPGVVADTEALLRLRHLVRHERGTPRVLTALPGGFVSHRRGRGLEIDEIRPFYEGDDIRHIDRNATARIGAPHVRMFRDERERTVLLLADFRPSMLWGSRRAFRSVAAAEALALVGWQAIDAGGRVGLMAFGPANPTFVPARGRERGMVGVIGALAAAHNDALRETATIHAAARSPTVEAPLDMMLERAARLVPKGGSVILATSLDHPGDGFDVVAGAIDRRSTLTIVLIRDAFERNAPAGAYPFLTDAGRSGWAAIGPSRGAAAPDQRIERLRHLGLAVVEFDVARGPEAMLVDWERLDGGQR
jgi:uncharacterized protein (DUF58 family)